MAALAGGGARLRASEVGGGLMALFITSVVRENGATCDHLVVTVNHEGASRTFKTSFGEVDRLLDSFDTPADAAKALVILWASYRRKMGRAILNVDIG